MAAGIFPEEDEHTIYFSRSDIDENFGTYSKHAFFLDDKEWPSVEHYYQALKFSDIHYQEKIRLSTSPSQAKKMGSTRFKRRRKDWKSVKSKHVPALVGLAFFGNIIPYFLTTHKPFFIVK